MQPLTYADLADASRWSKSSEYARETWVATASDLGLRAGQMPKRIEVADVGNRQPFLPIKTDFNMDGDLQAVTYMQQFGCLFLTIYND